MTIKPFRRAAKPHDSERGQVLVIFAAAFVVIIMMMALLFDGARGVVLRRQIQDASDAASLAAANVMQGTTAQGVSQKGCAPNPGPPSVITPQAWVIAAAKASVAQNLPGFDLAKVFVTCPGPDNYTVKVSMGENSPTFFGSIFGTGPLSVSTHSVAVNGASVQSQFSVVLLDPAHCGANCSPVTPQTWPNGRDGCPSFGLNGTITAQFDSAIYVNSACDAAHNGAFATKGGSATITFGNSSSIHLVGENKPQALVVTPTPLQHQKKNDDPLARQVTPPLLVAPGTIKQRQASKLVINGTQTVAQCLAKNLTGGLPGSPGCILRPGVYVGGIQLRSSAVVYLRPGIYVLKDGGLDLGAQTELYTIDATATSATQANWATRCNPSTNTNHTCGVLFYKTTVSSTDSINVSAGAVFMARSFDPDADTTLLTTDAACTACKDETYRHILIWQDAAPNASNSYSQPPITLQGGGGVTMSGAVYAPQAAVTLHGNSGGSGGVADLTLQFIVWDLDLSGNASFHFIFNANEFPTNLDYGLTQ
jgi:hypothetical protein